MKQQIRTSKTIVLVIATLTSFLTPFMGSSLNIALPAIGKEFHLTAISLSWVATAYILAAGIFLIPFGRIADLYGRKKILTWGVILFTVSSFLLGISRSAGLFIILRGIQGLAGSMILGTGMAILTSVFPPGERGKALGINAASVYAGLSLGPLLGGSLTQHLGWRSIFMVIVPIGLLILTLIISRLKDEWREAQDERFDLAGTFIYMISFTALMFGFSDLPRLAGFFFILAGITGIIVLVQCEIHTKNHILHLHLFQKNPVFFFSNLAALINYCAISAVSFLLSLYLQYIKDLSPQQAGLVLLCQPVVQAIFSPMSGRLSDKVQPRIVTSLGMAITVIGLFFMSFIQNNTPLSLIVLYLMILGISFALFSSPNTNAVMSSIDKRYYGIGSAMLGTMRLTGQMLSMGIVMLLFSLFIGKVKITPENYPLFLKCAKTAFALFAGVSVFGVISSLARGKLKR